MTREGQKVAVKVQYPDIELHFTSAVSWKREVERNGDYWKEGRAHVDSIETLCINDTNARMSALQSGEVHFINRVDYKTAALLERSDAQKLVSAQGGRFYPFVMITDRTPLDNNHIRLALKFACDRERILQTVLLGHGYVSNDHAIPRIDPFFHSELPQRPFPQPLAAADPRPDPSRTDLPQAQGSPTPGRLQRGLVRTLFRVSRRRPRDPHLPRRQSYAGRRAPPLPPRRLSHLRRRSAPVPG